MSDVADVEMPIALAATIIQLDGPHCRAAVAGWNRTSARAHNRYRRMLDRGHFSWTRRLRSRRVVRELLKVAQVA